METFPEVRRRWENKLHSRRLAARKTHVFRYTFHRVTQGSEEREFSGEITPNKKGRTKERPAF
jgi:hypothetical protein